MYAYILDILKHTVLYFLRASLPADLWEDENVSRELAPLFVWLLCCNEVEIHHISHVNKRW